MAIQVPTDAKIITDQSLDRIALLGALCKKKGRLDQLKAKLREALAGKKAQFAESDLALARVKPIEPREFVNQHQLYKLVETKKLTFKQYQDCVCIRTSILRNYLSLNEIAAISAPSPTAGDEEGDAALYPEIKGGVSIDWEAVEQAMVDAAKKSAKSRLCIIGKR